MDNLPRPVGAVVPTAGAPDKGTAERFVGNYPSHQGDAWNAGVTEDLVALGDVSESLQERDSPIGSALHVGIAVTRFDAGPSAICPVATQFQSAEAVHRSMPCVDLKVNSGLESAAARAQAVPGCSGLNLASFAQPGPTEMTAEQQSSSTGSLYDAGRSCANMGSLSSAIPPFASNSSLSLRSPLARSGSCEAGSAACPNFDSIAPQLASQTQTGETGWLKQDDKHDLPGAPSVKAGPGAANSRHWVQAPAIEAPACVAGKTLLFLAKVLGRKGVVMPEVVTAACVRSSRRYEYSTCTLVQRRCRTRPFQARRLLHPRRKLQVREGAVGRAKSMPPTETSGFALLSESTFVQSHRQKRAICLRR